MSFLSLRMLTNWYNILDEQDFPRLIGDFHSNSPHSKCLTPVTPATAALCGSHSINLSGHSLRTSWLTSHSSGCNHIFSLQASTAQFYNSYCQEFCLLGLSSVGLGMGRWICTQFTFSKFYHLSTTFIFFENKPPFSAKMIASIAYMHFQHTFSLQLLLPHITDTANLFDPQQL